MSKLNIIRDGFFVLYCSDSLFVLYWQKAVGWWMSDQLASDTPSHIAALCCRLPRMHSNIWTSGKMWKNVEHILHTTVFSHAGGTFGAEGAAFLSDSSKQWAWWAAIKCGTDSRGAQRTSFNDLSSISTCRSSCCNIDQIECNKISYRYLSLTENISRWLRDLRHFPLAPSRGLFFC